MAIVHFLRSQKSADVIFRLTQKHDDVRFWFTTYGTLCAVWYGKNGSRYAIHQVGEDCTVYKTV